MTELLLTRPIDQAQEFAASVAAALPGRYEPVYWPLIRIEREPAELALDDVQGLLFTSANGVRAFAQASPRRDIPALCVGDGTATAARAAGLIASSARGDAGALAQLAVASHLPGAGAYLHLRGRDTTGDIAGALAVEGIEVREAVLYAARPAMDVPEAAASLLTDGLAGVVTLFSPRTARIFAGFAADAAAAGRAWSLHATTGLAISRAAAEPLMGLGFGELALPAQPNAQAMVAALGAILDTGGGDSV